MLQDLRYATRTLIKTPGYTAVALLALALGIGANAAIFSFVDVMLLRPLPYPDADRLYVPVSINPGRGIERGSVTYADYEDWRRDQGLFDAVAILQPGAIDISGEGGDPERASAVRVSEDFFSLVDVQPATGRGLVSSDHGADAAPVAVISHGLWQRRFGGEPDVVGRPLRIGGVLHDIVGVLPPRATYPEETQLFLPMQPSAFNDDTRTRRDNMIFQGLARLARGVTSEQAEAGLRTIAARLEQENPASRKGWTNGLVPLRQYIVGPELETALYVLLAAVGVVLLIACANLANLTLVRGAGRAREMGVRLAIGASRARLVRQLAAESMVLGILGGALGVAVAALAVGGLVVLAPPGAPFLEHVTLDGRVLLAAAAMTIFTVVIVGLLPALRISGVELTDALKEGARGSGHGHKTTMLRNALVVSEIAAAVVLLVAAGLLIRSLDRVTSAPPGVDIDRVLAARIALPGARYTPLQRTAFFRALIDRLASEPGVEAAAVTSYLPAGGGGFGLGRVFLPQGRPEPPAGEDVAAAWVVVSPDYFRTLGVTLVAGRTFEDRDGPDATPAMIVSQSFASRMFPDGDALGRRVRSWRDENVYREVVGVVSDVPFSSLTDRGRAIVYVPHAQQEWGSMTIAVRAASGPPEQLASTLRGAVTSIDSELALSNSGTMEVFARNSIARERLSASLMGALAALALALAVLGVYGIMSYSVQVRRQEMGVRLALGASPRELYRLVLTRGLWLTATGLAGGLVLALGASRALESLLYQTHPLDPVAFGAMALALGTTAGIACVLPARRAASADPLAALRSE